VKVEVVNDGRVLQISGERNNVDQAAGKMIKMITGRRRVERCRVKFLN
jgi:hypothetical protein